MGDSLQILGVNNAITTLTSAHRNGIFSSKTIVIYVIIELACAHLNSFRGALV